MVGLVAAVMLGLVINECGELSPWLAQKLVRWAARVRYPTRVEELSVLIAERPGKLFKLMTASGFACAALTYRITHRKTVPVHSVTSRYWIGFGSALVAGVLLIGEVLLANVIISYMSPSRSLINPGPWIGYLYWGPRYLDLIILGVIAVFITAAELLGLSRRLPAGWATVVASFALVLINRVILHYGPVTELLLISVGGMAVGAGASTACAIRLRDRLQFSVIAASSTILGGGLLTLSRIFWVMSTSTPWYVDPLAELLGLGFAVGLSAGVGVLLWRSLCGTRLSQSSAERVSRTAT